MINIDELVQVYQKAQNDPVHFDQQARGYRNKYGSALPLEGIAAVRRAGRDGTALYWRRRTNGTETLDGVVADARVTIQAYAAEALGLTAEQARRLFAMDNDLGEIRRLIRLWTGVDPHLAPATIS